MRKKGDIELLELIAKDPQAFILKQGGALVSGNRIITTFSHWEVHLALAV